MISHDERLRRQIILDHSVVKSNDLIQRTRYNLSLPEQKTIAYICSMIKPPDKDGFMDMEYEFDILDYCQLCNIDYDNGKNYMDVKASLQKLSDKSMWLKRPDGGETLVRWLAKVHTNKRSGKVKIEIDRDLAPYLLNLKEQFTQYQLREVLGMKSRYSIRIFELLKSYEYQHEKVFDIDYLKELLMVSNVKSYSNFKDFRKYVLEPAMKEINELTYLRVSYEPEKKGKRVVKVKFKMTYTDNAVERSKAWRAQDKVLGIDEWEDD